MSISSCRIADDELILGWRNSEWTGIAPFLEEDVAFSSIAQNEIGHARALYELAARELGTDADALAFDRKLEEYRSRAARRAAAAGVGEDDRPPLAVRDRRRGAVETLKRSDDAERRGPRGEDRPRGALPPDACRAVERAAAPLRRGRARLGEALEELALRARRARRRVRRSSSSAVEAKLGLGCRTPSPSRAPGARPSWRAARER